MFLFSFQQMDKQMDTTATWNVKGKGDTVRLVGLGSLDSPHCSVHAISLHYRVLFKHVCELGWMSTVGRSGDRY